MKEIACKTTKDLFRQRSKEESPKIPTGFKRIDKITSSGFESGELILMAGRTQMGTTSLALNMALNVVGLEKATVYVGLNEFAERIAMKLEAIESGVDIHLIEDNMLQGETYNNVNKARERLMLKPLLFIDNPYMKVTDTIEGLKILKQMENIEFVIIDKLHSLVHNSRKEDKSLRASDILYELKIAAMELNVAVMVLCGLKRIVENRRSHIPCISDLATDDYTEEAADKIILFHRDAYYDPFCKNDKIAYVTIAKNKNGKTGTAELYWDDQYLRFSDI